MPASRKPNKSTGRIYIAGTTLASGKSEVVSTTSIRDSERRLAEKLGVSFKDLGNGKTRIYRSGQ